MRRLKQLTDKSKGRSMSFDQESIKLVSNV